MSATLLRAAACAKTASRSPLNCWSISPVQLWAPQKQASPQRSGQASVANKNTLQQTPKEVKRGTYKPSELLLERLHLHEFLRTLPFFFSRSRACVSRSSSMSACTRNAKDSRLNKVAPARAPQAVRQYCSPAWKKTRLPARGTSDGHSSIVCLRSSSAACPCSSSDSRTHAPVAVHAS